MSSPPATAASPPEVATLLGARGLDDALLCLASLQRHSRHPFRFRLHDDGTLQPADLDRLRATLDVARVVSRAEADAEASRRLRAYPASAALRARNVLGLKLFDVVWFETGTHLRYVDSDVLFLRPFSGPPAGPAPAGAVFFPDTQSAYSLRFWELLEPGAPALPERLNSGLFVTPTEALDWPRVERFLARWRGRAPEWIEQTCWALLAGHERCALLDPSRFRIHDPRRAVGEEVVALHFVSSVRADLRRFAAAQAPSRELPVVEASTVAAAPLTPAAALRESLHRRLRR